jgi:uncharacterized protein (TIGR03435 family)
MNLCDTHLSSIGGNMRFVRSIIISATALVVVGLGAIGFSTSALAQSASESPAFQSVSIAQSHSTAPLARINTQDGTANFSGYSLQELIKYAYGTNDLQIVGAPDWIASKKYDINAKGPGNNAFTFEQMRLSVEKLLADQFKLTFHRETRTLPVYELTVAADGMKLEELQPGGGIHQSKLLFNSGHVDADGVTMAAFAQGLAQPIGTLVVDKTGLTGAYDFSLDWPSSQNVATSICQCYSSSWDSICIGQQIQLMSL